MWDTWRRTATVRKPKGKRKLARTRRRKEKDRKWVLKKWILLAQEETSGKLF